LWITGPVLRTVEKSTAQAALPDDEPVDPLEEEEDDVELPDPEAAGVLVVDEPFEEPESDDFEAPEEELESDDDLAESDPLVEDDVDPAVSEDLPLLRESVR